MMKRDFTFQKRLSTDPLYKQVADYLQELILSGSLAKGEQLPSEVDLAEKLQVSRLTLRKSLSMLISRELITQIPHCGTFVAEPKQKRLRIGLLYYQTSSSGFNGLYGDQLLLHICQTTNRYPDVEIVFLNCYGFTKKKIEEQISRSNCDGYIVLYMTPLFFQILDLPKYDTLPVVYINKCNSYVRGLRFNVALGNDPLKNVLDFLAVSGHKRIAYISVNNGQDHITERNESFLKHCPDEAVAIIRHSRKPWFDIAREETIRLCRSRKRPTAILTPGLSFTAGVWHGLMECRLTVPNDISLIGFDHIGNFFPMLSTIEQPLGEMAEKAVSLICETVRGKVYRNHTFLYKTVFFDRGSVKKLCTDAPQKKDGKLKESVIERC